MNVNANRLFVPLSTEPYIWFQSGNKNWELRKYGRQFTERTVYCGRRVELRRGYSNPLDSIWGTILNVQIAETIEEFFHQVDFSKVIPVADDYHDAVQMAKAILDIKDKVDILFLGFEVRLD